MENEPPTFGGTSFWTDFSGFPIVFSIEKTMGNPLKSVQNEVPPNVGGSFSTLRHPIHLIFDFLARYTTPLHRV